jgi:YVTN family beta-propeller protein
MVVQGKSGRYRVRSIGLVVLLVTAGAVALGLATFARGLPLEGTVAVSTSPQDVAYAASNHELYVAFESGYVEAFSPSNRLVATIALPVNPYRLVYDPSDQSIYVADLATSSVTVINTTTNAVTRTIPVGANPDGIAYDPATDAVYVANSGSDNVSVIPTGASTVSTTIGLAAGAGPSGVAYDPGNSEVYVAEGGLNLLVGIDGTLNFVSSTTPTGSDPQDVAASPANGLVYVANEASRNLSVVDSASNTVVDNITLPSYPMRLTYDPVTSDILTAESFGTSVVFVTPGDQVAATVQVGSNPAGMAYDLANQRVYVANQGSATLSYFGASSFAVVATDVVGPPSVDPFGMAYDPISRLLYVADNGGHVSTISATQLVSTLAVGQNPEDVLYDPATGDVYVANHGLAYVNALYGSNGSSIGKVGDGYGGKWLALDTTNGVIYVANDISGNLTGFDPVTLTTVANITLFTSATADAYDPADGNLYVAEQYTGNVSIVNPATGKIVTNLTVGGYPQSVVYDPATHDVYVANEGSVSVISSLTHRVVATIGGLGFPEGLAYDPANRDIVATGYQVVNWISPSGRIVATDYLQSGVVYYCAAYDSANSEMYFSPFTYTQSVVAVGG